MNFWQNSARNEWRKALTRCTHGQYSTGFNLPRTNNLPVVAQILMLTTDFGFKAGVIQAARSTEEARQITADSFQELLRGHALYRLTFYAIALSSPSACAVSGGNVDAQTRREFIADFPSDLKRENGQTDWLIRKTVCLMREHGVQATFIIAIIRARYT